MVRQLIESAPDCDLEVLLEASMRSMNAHALIQLCEMGQTIPEV